LHSNYSIISNNLSLTNTFLFCMISLSVLVFFGIVKSDKTYYSVLVWSQYETMKKLIGLSFINRTFFHAIIYFVIMVLVVMFQFLSEEGQYISFLHGSEVVISTRTLLTQGIPLILITFFMFMINTVTDSKVKVEYFYLLVLLTSFAVYLGLCEDLIGVMLVIEGISFILYVFAIIPFGNSYKYLSINRIKSYIRYIFVGLFSSSLLLFGLSIMYFITGLLHLFDVYIFIKYFINMMGVSDNLLFATVLILSGILFKLAVVPFHGWLVDVYMRAENITVCFFSIFTKAVFITILVIKFNFLVYFTETTSALCFCGLASILIGTLGAFAQRKINGLIAYSSIVNVGYVVVLISSAYLSSQSIAVAYITFYSLINLIVFYVLFLFNRSHLNKDYLVRLDDFKGLYYNFPGLSVLLSLAIFALMGLPPFVSFFMKFYALNSIFMYLSKVIAVIILVLMVVSFSYYIRLVKNALFFSLNDNRFISQTWSNQTNCRLYSGYFFAFALVTLASIVGEVLSFVENAIIL
jgi:NADH-quinone oxidoreductase subunit N